MTSNHLEWVTLYSQAVVRPLLGLESPNAHTRWLNCSPSLILCARFDSSLTASFLMAAIIGHVCCMHSLGPSLAHRLGTRMGGRRWCPPWCPWRSCSWPTRIWRSPNSERSLTGRRIGLSTLPLGAPPPWWCCWTGWAVWAWMARCCNFCSRVPSAEMKLHMAASQKRPVHGVLLLGHHFLVVVKDKLISLSFYSKWRLWNKEEYYLVLWTWHFPFALEAQEFQAITFEWRRGSIFFRKVWLLLLDC